MMKHSLKLAVLLVTALTVAPVAFAQSPGASAYKAKCAMCHRPDGKAATPMKDAEPQLFHHWRSIGSKVG